MQVKLIASAALLSLATSAASAATLGTITFSNSDHYGYFGFASTSANNTKRSFSGGPFSPLNMIGTARRIHVTGQLKTVHPDAWASSIQVQPSGGGMAGYQPSWRFSDQRKFELVDVDTTIYAPGGFDASKIINLEMFSLDAEQFVPGLDARSTLTYTFDDTFAPGSVEYSGALTTSDPTFNRPFAYEYRDGNDVPHHFPPELTGAHPYYDVQAFHVSTAGEYSMITANEYESSVVLYEGAFDPNDPLKNFKASENQSENVVRSNYFNNLPNLDDATGASMITADLVPGVNYYFVTTAFNAPGVELDGGPFVGRYRNLITGAGTVMLGQVPEPASLIALAVAAPLVRRRRTV